MQIEELSDSTRGVYSHILHLGGIKILLNCGTNESVSFESYLNVSDIDFVLLSHFTIPFLGGFPFVCEKNRKAKIFASIPVKNLGKVVLMEHYKNLKFFKEKEIFAEEVERYFDEIHAIKYLQTVELANEVTITAYNCGYAIGGTVWKITKGAENILFGINIDHRKVNHLNGIDLPSLPKDSTCIFDVNYAAQKKITRKERNSSLKSMIDAYLKQGKKILVLIGYHQILEFALILDDILKLNSSKRYIASCIGFMAKRFSELVKSMVEWCGDNISKEFMENKDNPFSFKFIKFVENYENLDKNSQIFIAFETFGFAEKILELRKDSSETVILNFTGTKIEAEMKIQKIPTFKWKKKVQEVDLESTGTTETDFVEEKDERQQAWYDIGFDIWADGREVYFPEGKKPKPYDDYNEIFSHEIFKKKTEIFEMPKHIEQPKVEEYEEEIRMVACDFAVKAEVFNLTIDSISDCNSAINVMEYLSPRNLILIGTASNFGNLFYHLCKFNKNFKDVNCIRDVEKISSEKQYVKCRLDASFTTMEYKMLKNEKLLGFRGFVENGVVKYFSRLRSPVLTGGVQINNLKRALVEQNLKVEIVENTLIIEDDIRITDDKNRIILIGKCNNLFYKIRNILNESVTYL